MHKYNIIYNAKHYIDVYYRKENTCKYVYLGYVIYNSSSYSLYSLDQPTRKSLVIVIGYFWSSRNPVSTQDSTGVPRGPPRLIVDKAK